MELFGPAGLRRSCRCVSQRTAWSRSSRPTPDAHNVDADAHSDGQPQPQRHHLVSLVSIARHVRDKWLGNGRRSGSEESLSEIAFRNLNFLAMN